MSGKIQDYINVDVIANRPASPAALDRQVFGASDTGAISGWDGSSWHALGGGSAPSLAVATKTANYTILTTDDVILADATSGAITISLPTAVAWTKRITVIKIDSSANAVTVGTTGGQTINGQSSRLLAAQFSGATLVSDNANWRRAEQVLPLTGKGDLLVGLAAQDLQRLAVGSDTQVLTADSTQATGVKWSAGGGSLTSVSAHLAADVTISAINTFFDGPSVSCVAGTWLIIASITCTVGAGAFFTAKLWDGTTVAASQGAYNATATAQQNLTVAWIVAPGSTTTYKVSVAVQNGTTSTIAAAAANNSAGNNASSIVGVKIA